MRSNMQKSVRPVKFTQTSYTCRLSKNQWRQVIKKQSPNSRRRANHSHHYSTKRKGQNSRLSITAAPRREGQNPRLSITVAPRREGQNPRLSITAAPRREAQNPRLSITLATRRKVQNPCLDYNCPHYWVNYCQRNERVNPHYGVFLGDTFTPWNLYKWPCSVRRRCGWIGKFWVKKKRISVASCRSTKTSTEKKERVQLF